MSQPGSRGSAWILVAIRKLKKKQYKNSTNSWLLDIANAHHLAQPTPLMGLLKIIIYIYIFLKKKIHTPRPMLASASQSPSLLQHQLLLPLFGQHNRNNQLLLLFYSNYLCIVTSLQPARSSIFTNCTKSNLFEG